MAELADPVPVPSRVLKPHGFPWRKLDELLTDHGYIDPDGELEEISLKYNGNMLMVKEYSTR